LTRGYGGTTRDAPPCRCSRSACAAQQWQN